MNNILWCSTAKFAPRREAQPRSLEPSWANSTASTSRAENWAMDKLTGMRHGGRSRNIHPYGKHGAMPCDPHWCGGIHKSPIGYTGHERPLGRAGQMAACEALLPTYIPRLRIRWRRSPWSTARRSRRGGEPAAQLILGRSGGHLALYTYSYFCLSVSAARWQPVRSESRPVSKA